MMLRVAAAWVLAGFLVGRTAAADVKLPALVSDGMVLQQRAPVRIWGWAAEGERVTVTLRGQSAAATARGGRWSVSLPALEPGGPFEMTIAGRNTLIVRDVLVGDVWVCSGQSNMEFALEQAAGAQVDITAPPDPSLRLFTVERQLAAAPREDVAGAWQHAAPSSRRDFSAVGYYFGRALRAARGVPIGLIHTSWGGSPAEAWTSREVLRKWGLPEEAFAALAPPTAASRAAYEQRLREWEAAGRPRGTFDDPGIAPSAASWASPEFEARAWRSLQLPGPWERPGLELIVDGGIWFRTEVSIPSQWKGRELDLHLGAIDDLDATYFNGELVGATGPDVPAHWQVRRRYRVPASAAREGRAVIAVRVWDRGGDGGFMGPADAMWLAPRDAKPSERLSLAGRWRFEAERVRPSQPQPPGLGHHLPSALYNGMIAPLLPFAIKGVTWYQGESNTGRAEQYRSLLGAMIESWRASWRVGPFPFLIVQLAPYQPVDAEPRESDWAALREAQAQTARELENVGLVVTTDVGDQHDIHPKRKRPIGDRLALAARRVAYGERVIASGPRLRSAKPEGNTVVVTFDDVGAGLEVRGKQLTGFAVAGLDERFFNADATVSGDRVIVSSPHVPAPAYVRFGWANYPVVNLWNADGLPAVPFRTDPP